MSDDELKEVFDWAVFGECLFSLEEQKRIIRRLIELYPSIYKEWLSENKGYLEKYGGGI
jgi:hypothetical protein